jgi:fructose-1,6-bisphosphatase/inositol monophosphatase family enzyme
MQYDALRQCMIRERKIFKDMVSEVDRKDPQAIPNYLEKHFKEKAARKKEIQMMGGTTDDMR